MGAEQTPVTDAECLKRYIQSGPDAELAFQCLAERHASMVYGVCLRSLGDRHLAEDAAQAVFIILAEKASRMGGETNLPGWLFRTARFVARNAQRERASQIAALSRAKPELERKAQTVALEDVRWEELKPHLDEALEELSAKSREALVLHYLSGLSNAEAAERLGCNEEAVKKRVQYGLERLRHKLAARGAVLSVAGLAGLLGARAFEAAPGNVVEACGAAAIKGMAVQGTAGVLAKGAMNMMILNKLWQAGAAALVMTVCGVGGALTLRGLGAEERPPAPPAPELPKEKQDAPARIEDAAIEKLLVKTLGEEPKYGQGWARMQGNKKATRVKNAEFERLFAPLELWHLALDFGGGPAPYGGGPLPSWAFAVEHAQKRAWLVGCNVVGPFEKNVGGFLAAAQFTPKDEAHALRAAKCIVRLSTGNGCVFADDENPKVSAEGKDAFTSLGKPAVEKEAAGFRVKLPAYEEFWFMSVRFSVRDWTAVFGANAAFSLEARKREPAPVRP